MPPNGHMMTPQRPNFEAQVANLNIATRTAQVMFCSARNVHCEQPHNDYTRIAHRTSSAVLSENVSFERAVRLLVPINLCMQA